MENAPPSDDQPAVVVVFPDVRREPATWYQAGGYFWAAERVGFWNRVLTQSEKDELYLNGSSNNYPFN